MNLRADIGQLSYLTDVAIDLSNIIQGLWTFHFTVAIAALGWAMTSRSWARGLNAWICIAGSISLAVIFALNLLSLHGMYQRANLALTHAGSIWSDHDGLLDPLLTVVLPGTSISILLAVVALADVVAVILVGLLLSNLGRQPKAA